MNNPNKSDRNTFRLGLGALLLSSALAACSHNNTASNRVEEADTAAELTLDAVAPTVAVAEHTHSQPMPQMLSKHSMSGAVVATRSKQPPQPVFIQTDENRERYAEIDSNTIKRTSEQPVSTFSLDVDTGSYAVVRRHIQHGQLPPANAVRLEELVNYFNYSYPEAEDKDHPFAFETELSDTAWNTQRQVLRVSLAAWKQPIDNLPPSNLVFLVDVSGSMQASDKLPLLKASLKLLVQQMRPQDSVSLVTYAGQSAVILEPTSGEHKRKIVTAIDSLGAGGGTHGAAGLKDAYRLASENKIEGGINRVLLATDGDFNVGLSDTQSLVDYISKQRKDGITLTTLGFGQGNYNDHLMEQLADKGDGNHAYIDTLMEAKKVLMEQVGATLYTVAKDAKIQVEFNPEKVSEYRLLGYENRLLREQDFNNDKIDAGDIGAGHTVTALYEIALVGSEGEQLAKRRYSGTSTSENNHSDELAWVKLRYKPRGSESSVLLEHKIKASDHSTASQDLKFSSAVAAWADWLRQPESTTDVSINDIVALAESGKGTDPQGYRAEFIQLAKLSAALK